MQGDRKALALSLLLSAAALLPACTARDTARPGLFEQIDRAEEIRIGEENFEPVLQARGGRYTLDPRLDSYVSGIGMRLASASGVDLPWEFAIVNNSLPNAWSLPGGKIAINRGMLLVLEDEAELAAVLAHEVAHAANSHVARAMERGLLLEAAMQALGLGRNDRSAVGSGSVGIDIIAARFNQSAEFAADAAGMNYMAIVGMDPGGAVDLQRAMLRELGRPGSSWTAGVTASHPPSTERLAENERMREQLLANFPQANETGVERFQRMTRGIRRSAPAYVDYQVAIWELAGGDLEAAHKRITDALRVENREARFHALHAKYEEQLGNLQAALAHYDIAIRLEPAYHALHQGKGLVLLQLGDLDRARGSLAIANAQLQDAETHEGLGDIAVRQGRFNDALGHYTLASRSSGVAGKRARAKLVDVEAVLDQAEEPRTAESRRQSPN